jgi:hypothetical protein
LFESRSQQSREFGPDHIAVIRVALSLLDRTARRVSPEVANEKFVQAH